MNRPHFADIVPYGRFDAGDTFSEPTVSRTSFESVFAEIPDGQDTGETGRLLGSRARADLFQRLTYRGSSGVVVFLSLRKEDPWLS
jgi:hypothetical protein